jgi:surface antigen
MNPGLFTKAAKSLRKELAIVVIILLVLMLLPVAAIAGTTNIGALFDSFGNETTENQLYTAEADKEITYIYGYCTYWAALRRKEVGKPIPNTWGDAHTWDDRARTDGYKVDHIPEVHAIIEIDDSGVGDLGHVAFVERVGVDGSVHISEMNSKGWSIRSERTISVLELYKYNFIH